MSDQITIGELIKKLNLPPHTEFLGFVVHLPVSDEFLSSFDFSRHIDEYAWAKVPDLAHIFTSQSEAKEFVKYYGKSSMVGFLFDTGDTYYLQPYAD